MRTPAIPRPSLDLRRPFPGRGLPAPGRSCSCRMCRSSVASRTTRQDARILNFVLFHQPAPDLFLVARGLVAHGGDELLRPDVLLGMAMTIQAPLHLERVLLPGERHAIHSSVAA